LKTNLIAPLTAALGNIITVEGVTNISDNIDLGNYKLYNGKLIPLVKDFKKNGINYY